MVEVGYRDRGVEHLNIVVQDAELGLQGTIPFRGIVDSRVGVAIAVYTAERSMHKTGEKLPAPLDAYNDCPYMHYGVLLNCLAHMSASKPQDMIIVMNETHDLIKIQYRPHIAELFLGYMAPLKKDEEAKKRKGKHVKIDPNQKALF